MMRTLALIIWTGCQLLAKGLSLPANGVVDETKQTVQLTETKQLDLSAGGSVLFDNSQGSVTIEGWDQPRFEIVVIKSRSASMPPGTTRRQLANLIVCR